MATAMESNELQDRKSSSDLQGLATGCAGDDRRMDAARSVLGIFTRKSDLEELLSNLTSGQTDQHGINKVMVQKEVNKLGVLGATSYVVGSVIGSGIFISPKGILSHAGSVGLSLIIWVFAALLASLTAMIAIDEIDEVTYELGEVLQLFLAQKLLHSAAKIIIRWSNIKPLR
ncbi:Amino acid permease [Parelaphostrongylus tenuis]|uniref:Amino acid permease n=1 Tax=Parelaphostrongylus tenuis TaxID=148309 RepID=A0AAD5WL12_PARTN|nr:Amino acid permease [Parelaphostrongylus tenuis]